MPASGGAHPNRALAVFYLFYFALVGVLLPYWSLYLQALDYSAAQIGWVAAVIMVTRLGAPNVWGWLADRSGNRLAVIRAGCLAAVVCFAGLLLSREFAWMLVVVFGFSFFWNAVLAQFEVLTLQHLYPHTGRYGLIRIWGSVGFIVAVLCLGYALEFISALWVPWVAALLFVLLWLSAQRVPPAPAQAEAAYGGSLGVLHTAQFWLFLALVFSLQLAHGPYYTFYSIYLQSLGWQEGAIGLLWSLGVVAEILVFLYMPRLLSQWRLKRLLVVAVILSAMRWLLIGGLADWLPALLVAQALHAASFGVTHAVAIEWVRRCVPHEHAGQGQALYSSVSFGAGGALGALLSGLFWDWSAAGVFAGAALVCLFALLLMPKLKEPAL